MARFVPVGLFLLLGIGVASAGDPEFPLPRAEAEFHRLIPILEGAGATGAMDLAQFRALAGPCAPLDLEVSRGSNSEAGLLKNIYFGTAGRILKIDAAGLANDFHCGPACTSARRQHAVDRLTEIRELVSAFGAARGVTLVAQWQQPESFRVNRAYKLGKLVREAIPSAEMGFVPSGQWKDYESAESYFSKNRIARAQALEVVRLARKAGMAAIVLMPDGSVVVFLPGGVSDNQSGVIFQEAGQPAPRSRGILQNGLEYTYIEKLATGIYYFETT